MRPVVEVHSASVGLPVKARISLKPVTGPIAFKRAALSGLKLGVTAAAATWSGEIPKNSNLAKSAGAKNPGVINHPSIISLPLPHLPAGKDASAA